MCEQFINNQKQLTILPTVGKDYIPLVAAEIVFSYGASADNETASCIYLTVINDSILENAEFLSVSISSLLQDVLISPTMNFAYINIFEDPNDCKLEKNLL